MFKRSWSRGAAFGAIVLSSSLLAACGGKDVTSSAGRVSIALSSGAATASSTTTAESMEGSGPTWGDHCAVPQAASVTFSSILARTLEGKLVDVTIDLPVTVDLLALVNGNKATLPIGFLPPGTYDQFVVVMTKLELTLANGTKIAVTPPGGGWTAVVPASPPFTVVQDVTTAVTLHFRRDLSFGCNLGHWEFHPEFECRHH